MKGDKDAEEAAVRDAMARKAAARKVVQRFVFRSKEWVERFLRDRPDERFRIIASVDDHVRMRAYYEALDPKSWEGLQAIENEWGYTDERCILLQLDAV